MVTILHLCNMIAFSFETFVEDVPSVLKMSFY